MDKIDGLGVKCILYFINCRIAIAVLNLYLREKNLLTGQKRGGILWISLELFAVDANSISPKRATSLSHRLRTQVTSSEPSPYFNLQNKGKS